MGHCCSKPAPAAKLKGSQVNSRTPSPPTTPLSSLPTAQTSARPPEFSRKRVKSTATSTPASFRTPASFHAAPVSLTNGGSPTTKSPRPYGKESWASQRPPSTIAPSLESIPTAAPASIRPLRLGPSRHALECTTTSTPAFLPTSLSPTHGALSPATETPNPHVKESRDRKRVRWDHYTPITPQSGFRVAPTLHDPILPQGALSQDAPSAVEAPRQLWDLAYKGVRERDSKLVAAFERVMLSVDLEGDGLPLKTTDRESEAGISAERVGRVVQLGLSRTKKWAKGMEKVHAVSEVLKGISSIIQGTLSSAVPQAGAAWVGVSVLVKALSNLSEQSVVNRDGILYIGSRAMWYSELFSIRGRLSSQSASLRLQLEDMMVDLFADIITYQMRSVGNYYRNQLAASLRDAFAIRNWKEDLEAIRGREADVCRCLERYERKAEVELLTFLAETASALESGLRKQLDDLVALQAEALAVQKEEAEANARERTRNEEAQKRDEERRASEIVGKFKVEGLHYDDFMDRNPDPTEGTCGWFSKDKRVRDWEQGATNLMLVKAMPGQGKSVLARSLVHRWRARGKGTVCHFFFKDTNPIQKRADMALCAILHQILKDNLLLALDIESDVSQGGEALTQSMPELWKFLETATKNLERRRLPIICVLDALDECDGTQREALLGKVKGAAGNPSLKILMTTRPVDRILSKFSDIASIGLNPNENPATLSSEINMVIERRVDEMGPRKGWSDSLRAEIKQKLRGEGTPQYTYLWLRLIFELLDKQNALPKKTWINLISGLPKTVNDAYESLLSKVNPIEQHAVRKLLSIVLCAKRPLTVDEANAALSVASDSTENSDMMYMHDGNAFKKWVENHCGFFIQVYENRVQFIHQTAKEFLTDPTAGAGPEWRGSLGMHVAHRGMRDLCCRYLAEKTRRWRVVRSQDDRKSWFFRDMGEENSDCFVPYAMEGIEFHNKHCGTYSDKRFRGNTIFDIKSDSPSNNYILHPVATFKSCKIPSTRSTIRQTNTRCKLEDELRSQQYVYDCLETLKGMYPPHKLSSTSARHEIPKLLYHSDGPGRGAKIRVPQLFHVGEYKRDSGTGFAVTRLCAVMEHIEGETLGGLPGRPDSENHSGRLNQVAEALAILLCFPTSSGPQAPDTVPPHNIGLQPEDHPQPNLHSQLRYWHEAEQLLRDSFVEKFGHVQVATLGIGNIVKRLQNTKPSSGPPSTNGTSVGSPFGRVFGSSGSDERVYFFLGVPRREDFLLQPDDTLTLVNFQYANFMPPGLVLANVKYLGYPGLDTEIKSLYPVEEDPEISRLKKLGEMLNSTFIYGR
ncbi:hypothetical protein B0H67DRAFT_591559 [Lasiosphaeris hirsuta]|uniref:NWD NACHT-NTPase N-terminal domain-containing protein n=1 Tax=Lasiosphaeris hirsuta TaxID=260670 RepID=A0AA40DI83_9PEZI|nr:hypothetical protein B0H67DRAFT_591559 [Lasiosphaeris hirsuta]